MSSTACVYQHLESHLVSNPTTVQSKKQTDIPSRQSLAHDCASSHMQSTIAKIKKRLSRRRFTALCSSCKSRSSDYTASAAAPDPASTRSPAVRSAHPDLGHPGPIHPLALQSSSSRRRSAGRGTTAGRAPSAARSLLRRPVWSRSPAHSLAPTSIIHSWRYYSIRPHPIPALSLAPESVSLSAGSRYSAAVTEASAVTLASYNAAAAPPNGSLASRINGSCASPIRC
jgi:hypothetical protein